MYQHLLTPIALGPTQVRNRVFNPPHGTTLSHHGMVTEDLIAYHETRARGGVGLIILEGMTLHPSYGFEDAFLYAGHDKIIPGLKNLGSACRAHGTPVFGQLFHAGRAVRLTHDGSRPLTYSASDVPDERYRVIPVPMPNEMVWEMVHSYARAAERLAEAELDGVEILASMGYLIAQFLNPITNRREDEFGGSFENRLRFLREIIIHCRHKIGPDKTLGIRITLDEKTDTGIPAEEMLRVCQTLDQDNQVDYFSVISGSTSAPAGWIHVFPPMAIPQAFVADDAARLKQVVSKPVLVAGRVNQPQTAEAILHQNKTDMVGMVRALITDPELVNKAAKGQADQIRACVGCNQACVGHRLAHHPISCIQNPVSGRERHFQSGPKSHSKNIVVIGGGPGGMKAAVTAAERGHQVRLFEQTPRLGGQVNLAEKLPGRAEFGGVTTNLLSELNSLSVEINLNHPITDQSLEEILERTRVDVVINAVGATPRLPEVEVSGVDFIDAWTAIEGKHAIGHNVVIADWSCDWTGLGVAQKLAQQGHHVQLFSGASVPGESLQGIVRDQWIGELHKAGVAMTPFARLFGAEDGTVFFQHMTSGEPMLCEEADTLVSCYAPRSNPCLGLPNSGKKVGDTGPEIYTIGDAASPRTVEETILEAVRTVWAL